MKNVIRVENGSIINGQGGSGGSGGHTIQNDSGTALPQESALQFVGVYSEDDSTNGKTKVNIIREMTKAQMDALSTDAKKGVIHTTDEADNPANPISAEDVSYGDGTVADVLDGAKWTYLGQTTGNAEITIPDGVSEVYGRSALSSTSTSFHFLTIEGDIAVDRGGGYYVSATNCAAASYRWTKATRKANLNGLNFAGTDYTSTTITKWYVKA